MIDRSQIISLVKQECARRHLDHALICSIIEVESSFNPYKFKLEHSKDAPFAVGVCARALGITEETEEQGQQFSWGLGAVLGITARGLGFRGLLPSLCDPVTGIYWCCQAFEANGRRYKTVEEKVAAYNAGSVRRDENGVIRNQKYVDKVMKNYRGVKYE